MDNDDLFVTVMGEWGKRSWARLIAAAYPDDIKKETQPLILNRSLNEALNKEGTPVGVDVPIQEGERE